MEFNNKHGLRAECRYVHMMRLICHWTIKMLKRASYGACIPIHRQLIGDGFMQNG